MPSSRSRPLGEALRFVALMLFLGAPRPLAAQESSSQEAAAAQRLAEAKAKYQAGAEAYERRRYKDAVDAFLAADQLAPSAPLSFNIGRAYESLGDESNALRWYRDYLRRAPAATNAPSVRELVSRLAASLAKKGVQQVSVFSTPAGATVSVDDQPLGVTPCTFELAPGKHHLLVSHRGYVDGEQDIVLEALQPLDVPIRLNALAANAAVAPAVASPPSAATAPAAPAPPVHAPNALPMTHAKERASFGPVPWLTLGVGAVALGGALTFELMRRSAEDDAEHESTQLGFQSALDRMDSRKTTARVLLAVGGVAVVAGGVLAVLDWNASRSGVSVAMGCLPGGCATQVGGRF